MSSMPPGPGIGSAETRGIGRRPMQRDSCVDESSIDDQERARTYSGGRIRETRLAFSRQKRPAGGRAIGRPRGEDFWTHGRTECRTGRLTHHSRRPMLFLNEPGTYCRFFPLIPNTSDPACGTARLRRPEPRRWCRRRPGRRWCGRPSGCGYRRGWRA